MFNRLSLSLAVSIAVLAQIGNAHELWIDPLEHVLPAPGKVEAHVKVGQRYSGATYTYLPNDYVRLDITGPEGTEPVTGRMGDYPAIRADLSRSGLHVIALETRPQPLTYGEWEKFVGFVTHKDASFALDIHAERGWPQIGVTEAFSRHAKSLVAVGDGNGSDAELGLFTEFVALDNPYVQPVPEQIRVKLLLEGAPRPDAQVEIFERNAQRQVEVSFARTDENGVAVIPVRPGHRYMLDAVTIRPTTATEEKPRPMWLSYWANLTFEVPH